MMNRVTALSVASLLFLSACSGGQTNAPPERTLPTVSPQALTYGPGIREVSFEATAPTIPPGDHSVGTFGESAHYLVSMPNGTIWFALRDRNALGEISSSGIRVFNMPKSATANAGPFFVTRSPAGDRVWFTESNIGKIASVSPCDPNSIQEYAVSAYAEWGLAVSRNSAWVALPGKNAIAEVNLRTKKVVEHTLPTHGAHPGFVAIGPDGQVWFTEEGHSGFPPGSKIGSLNPSTGRISEYALPTRESSPEQIIAGPAGNMWFAESDTNKIGTINLRTHRISEYQIPGQIGRPMYPTHLANGPSGTGKIWFTERSGYVNSISTEGKFGKAIEASNTPFGISLGADNNMWIAQPATAGVIGEIAHFPPPGVKSNVLGHSCAHN